jgi:hypothetical protein
MTPSDLLTTLRRRGLTVTADGDVLVVRPRELLTEPASRGDTPAQTGNRA